MTELTEGVKYDEGKPRWDLLPYEELSKVVDVLTFGAKKYADDNWKRVPNAKARYIRAGMGHFTKWIRGERCDDETGISHLAHAICCLLFLMWFDRTETNKKDIVYGKSGV